MDLPIDAEVICKDGPGGRSKSIIIDPIHQKVTHIVIAEKRFPHIERLVPLELLVSTEASTIHLRCTRSELAFMEPFMEVEFITEEGISPEGEYRDRLYWPYVLPEGNVVLPIDIERIPSGEIEARRGMRVHAKAGTIGRVDEFIVDPLSGHITHMVLREGHLWGQRNITVPLSEIDGIEENGVYLKSNKNDILALPNVPVQQSKR